jgi:hypothetical protein
VLKKAAIIVAGSAAAILAAAPLALAHGNDHSPKCHFAKQNAANGFSQSATGVSAPFLGALGLAVPIAIPVNANVQAPIASCNNIENVLNPRIDHNLNHNSL